MQKSFSQKVQVLSLLYELLYETNALFMSKNESQ